MFKDFKVCNFKQINQYPLKKFYRLLDNYIQDLSSFLKKIWTSEIINSENTHLNPKDIMLVNDLVFKKFNIFIYDKISIKKIVGFLN